MKLGPSPRSPEHLRRRCYHSTINLSCVDPLPLGGTIDVWLQKCTFWFNICFHDQKLQDKTCYRCPFGYILRRKTEETLDSSSGHMQQNNLLDLCAAYKHQTLCRGFVVVHRLLVLNRPLTWGMMSETSSEVSLIALVILDQRCWCKNKLHIYIVKEATCP